MGRRVVRGGGSRYTEPQLVTPEVIAAIEELAQIDPEHAPSPCRYQAATAAIPQSTARSPASCGIPPRYRESLALRAAQISP